jgi:hypothetical protein
MFLTQVHPACLGEWITKRSESHNTVCEICNSPYEVDLVRSALAAARRPPLVHTTPCARAIPKPADAEHGFVCADDPRGAAAGLHWNRALLCSRASVGFFSEACTMLFCLVSLLWVFVLSHDWKPSNQKNDPDVRRIRADTSEPVFWLVLSIGLAMACFTLYTLRKVTTMRVATSPPSALSAP